VAADDIAIITPNVLKPLCVNMGLGIRTHATTPLIAPARLHEIGVAVVLSPRLLTACAVQGMQHGIAAATPRVLLPSTSVRI
jgi:hypothetical protein